MVISIAAELYKVFNSVPRNTLNVRHISSLGQDSHSFGVGGVGGGGLGWWYTGHRLSAKACGPNLIASKHGILFA